MKRTVAAAIFLAAATFVGSRLLALAVGADLATFDAGLIATFAGVVAGVPIALLISRISETAGARAEAERRAESRTRVLRILQKDLSETLDELIERDRSLVVARTLRTDVWQALSSSGNLARIDDPDLVNVLARAYHFIATSSDLERQTWLAYHDPAQWTGRVERGTGREVSGRFRRSLAASIVDMDPHTKAAIDVALTRLAAILGDPAPPTRALAPVDPSAFEDPAGAT